ncbi:unnamed protein product [Effrenium voratum]|nr:unnamed protein product [Effrenium voratum]
MASILKVEEPGGTGRSRSTSAGSSQSLVPPEEVTASSSGLEIHEFPGYEAPRKAQTFDDFISPAGSERGESSPSAPGLPGSFWAPLDPSLKDPVPLGLLEPVEPMEPMYHGLVECMEPNALAPSAWMELAPSVGSAEHGSGSCKPCAFHHTKGCQCGAMCTFCHLCLPGEKKRRQKEKQAAAKAKVRALN